MWEERKGKEMVVREKKREKKSIFTLLIVSFWQQITNLEGLV